MIYESLEKLISYAIANGLIEDVDVYVVRNMLLGALDLSDWNEVSAEYNGETIDELLSPVVSYACENGIINDTNNSRDLFDTKIMGVFTPMPREEVGS